MTQRDTYQRNLSCLHLIKVCLMYLAKIDAALLDAVARRRRNSLPFIFKLITFILVVFYCEVQGNATPYTIRRTSRGLLHRVHRDDSGIKEAIVNTSEESPDNVTASNNQKNQSIYFSIPPLLNEPRNASKADKMLGEQLTKHARFKRGVVHLYNMVVCATGCNPLAYKGYGCYCGFLGSGYVIDGIDRCCKMHDWCYDATECPVFMEYIAPYYWRCYHGHKPVCAVEHGKWGGSGSCAQRLCECDRSLAECLRSYPCPTTKAVCTSSPWRLVQNIFMII